MQTDQPQRLMTSQLTCQLLTCKPTLTRWWFAPGEKEVSLLTSAPPPGAVHHDESSLRTWEEVISLQREMQMCHWVSNDTTVSGQHVVFSSSFVFWKELESKVIINNKLREVWEQERPKEETLSRHYLSICLSRRSLSNSSDTRTFPCITQTIFFQSAQ